MRDTNRDKDKITYLKLLQEVGNQFLIDMYIKSKISYLELASEVGNSRAEIVDNYKKNLIKNIQEKQE